MNLNPHKIEERYDKEMTGFVEKARSLLRSKYGLWFLGMITFADSALGLPFTMDPFMAAYMVSNRSKALWGYVVTVGASVLGGICLYFFSKYFIEQILTFFSPQMVEGFNSVAYLADKGVFLFTFLGSFSPIPYTFIAIVAGSLKLNLFMFITGSLIGRAIRFGVVAYFVHFFGERAIELAKRNIVLASGVVVVLVAVILFFHR